MRGLLSCLVVAVVCALPCAAGSQEVITGPKFNAFIASSGNYMNLPVILEDTFSEIDTQFNTIELGNNITSSMYVKFKVGQCPYPCIGMRIPSVMNGLNQVGPGDLVRVTGSLTTIQEQPKSVQVRGKYTAGPSYRESYRVYGPMQTEIYFSVSKVEKGWGKNDTPEEMFEEGKNLKEENYQEVKPGEEPLSREEVEKLVDKAIWFQGTYVGLDESIDEMEKAAGVTSEKVIKFGVKTANRSVPCYIPFSESNLKGFKGLPVGSEVRVYGRVRIKETPKGPLAGFVADKVEQLIVREGAPAAEAGAAPAADESAPPVADPVPMTADEGDAQEEPSEDVPLAPPL